MFAQIPGAMKFVDNKANQYQNSIERIHCPSVLDVERLKSLTNEPTKSKLYDFIIENYEVKMIKEVQKHVLKNHIQTEILDKMAKIFKALGYFNMDNILKGKASEGVSKIKGVFK